MPSSNAGQIQSQDSALQGAQEIAGTNHALQREIIERERAEARTRDSPPFLKQPGRRDHADPTDGFFI